MRNSARGCLPKIGVAVINTPDQHLPSSKCQLVFVRLAGLLRFVRLSPFDVSTEEGRAQERYRRAFLTAIANVLSKVLSMATLVVSVPLTLNYLGNERFGIWMTISSFTALLAFLDFGIGYGLLNQVAREAARGDRERLRHAITNGLLILTAVGVLIGALLWAVSQQVPWLSMIKVGNPALATEIRSSATAFALVFGLSLPFVGLQRIFLGLQEGFLVHSAAAVASLMSLLLLVIVTQHQGGIPELILATFGVQALSSIVLTPVFLHRRYLISISVGQLRADAAILIRTGGLFFALQLGAMVMWGGDSLLVSSMLGASQAAILAVTYRLFQFVTQPLAMVVNPLWSGYADAAERNDFEYIRKTLKTSIVASFLMALCAAAVVLGCHRWLIAHWTGHAIEVPILLALGCAVWSVVDVTGNAFAMFLNGLGVLRPQVMVVILFCLIAIPLKFFLVDSIGLPGVVLATLISYLLGVAFPYLTFLRPTWASRFSNKQ